MGDDFDALVEKLQEQIFNEAKEAFGEKGFQRWRSPLYKGILENADAHARIKGICGDTMEVFMKFENNRVTEASYMTDGCGASIVCGSFAAEITVGKTPDELTAITGESILKKIGRLPKENEHCAFLAAETIQDALNNYMIRQTRKKGRK
jgi:nitrogen fixation protein NifU and related proteins